MSQSRICVAVRKRPVSDTEKDVVNIQNQQHVCIVNEPRVKYDLTPYIEKHPFQYDETFDETVSNREVYARCAQALIDTVFSYGNATCFAYGQTGSGKTHTMLGKGDEPGLYVCAAHDVFQRAAAKKMEVFASFYEIYGRKLFDLLNNRTKLFCREDGDKVINICGLSEHSVTNIEDLFDIISKGSGYRAAGHTSANAESSRSHAVLQLEVREKSTCKTVGRLSFIDLAGNERGSDTYDADRRTRMEGAEINKSLLALKECIRALGMGKSHVPFRGSVLTEVLRDSFLGNSRTTMIACFSPNACHCEHTLNTLRYTQRVKELGGDAGKDKKAGKAGPGSDALGKPMLAGQQNRKRPDWITDFGAEGGGGGNKQPSSAAVQPQPHSGGGQHKSAGNKPNLQHLNQKLMVQPAQRRGSHQHVITDPEVASIIQKFEKDLDEAEAELIAESDDETGEEEEEELQSGAFLPPPSKLNPSSGIAGGQLRGAPINNLNNSGSKKKSPSVPPQVKAVYTHLVATIQQGEEDLMVQHRCHVDSKMHLMKEEVLAIQQLDDGQIAVDEYVSKVESLLVKQLREIQGMRENLSKMQGALKEEEVLSRTFTPAVKQRPGIENAAGKKFDTGRPRVS